MYIIIIEAYHQKYNLIKRRARGNRLCALDVCLFDVHLFSQAAFNINSPFSAQNSMIPGNKRRQIGCLRFI